jgi:large subunit ribosomal protein L18
MVTMKKNAARQAKAQSLRRRLRRESARPRLSVCRSLKHISCQLIDDFKGHTLASASSIEKEIRGQSQGVRKSDIAKQVGTLLASRAKAAGVTKVAFDRGAFRYHGRIKALADAAREGGLEF